MIKAILGILLLTNLNAFAESRQDVINEIKKKTVLAAELERELQGMERVETSRGIFYRPANTVKWVSLTGALSYGLFGVAMQLQVPRLLIGAKKTIEITKHSRLMARRFYVGALFLGAMSGLAYFWDRPSRVKKTSINEEEYELLRTHIREVQSDLIRLRGLLEKIPE